MLEGIGHKCCGCGSCYNACKLRAIQMKPDAEGFLYPSVNSELCVSCGRCEKSCPILNVRKRRRTRQAYACYCTDKTIHMASSSGAVFALLATKVIEAGGVVFGAAFDEGMRVFHKSVDNLSDLDSLKGSKYVQSATGSTFSQVKVLLGRNVTVLYSGTPCQIAGLKAFLGCDDKSLICVEVVCHGAPSNSVWQKYLREVAPHNRVTDVSFRNKERGIHDVTLDYSLDDGTVIKEEYGNSAYMTGFTQNMFLRPSCYLCTFKGYESYGDITLGDFWGVDEFYPGFGDGYGVSAVLIHSKAGERWFRQIRECMIWRRTNPKLLAPYNRSLVEPAKMNEKRSEFFERVDDEFVHAVVESLYDASFWDDDMPTDLFPSRLTMFVHRVFHNVHGPCAT